MHDGTLQRPAAAVSAGGAVSPSAVHAFDAGEAAPDLVVDAICAAVQEVIAATAWLSRRAGELGIADAGEMTAARTRGMSEAGVSAARDLLDEYWRHLAYGIADLHQILAPHLIVLHGDVVGSGEEFRAQLEHEVSARVPAHPEAVLRLVLGTDDDLATVRGAAAVALFHTLQLDI